MKFSLFFSFFFFEEKTLCHLREMLASADFMVIFYEEYGGSRVPTHVFLRRARDTVLPW